MVKVGGGNPLVEPELSPVRCFSVKFEAAVATSLGLLLAEAWLVESLAFVQRSFGSWLSVPGLEYVMDKLAVLAHGPDHRMIAQECEHFLLERLALDQCSHDPEVIGPVAGGNLARL